MRLARYVLAEIALASALLVTGAAVGWGALALIARFDAPAVDRSTVDLEFPRRSDLSNPGDPRIAAEPAGTFLGISDELLLERLRTQPIVGMKLNRGGSSLSFRVDLADGSRAAFKPAQTNLQTIPRKEVAAYRINRLLGLNGVPPAVPRLVSRDEIFSRLHRDSVPALARIRAETIFNPEGKTAGVFSFWIPAIKDSGLDTPEGMQASALWLSQGVPLPQDRSALAAQLSNLIVFDFLINNPDRHSGGNMKMSLDGDRLFFMDNTLAFFLSPDGHEKNRGPLQRTQRFSRRLIAGLERLTVPVIERALAESGVPTHEILTAPEVRSVVARASFVKRHVAALVALHGEASVLAFP